MKDNNPIWIMTIIFFAVVIGLCGFMILFKMGGGGIQNFSLAAFAVENNAALRQTTTLTVTEGTTLNLTASHENIYYLTGDSDRLVIKEYYRRADKRARINQSGQTVTVEGQRPQMNRVIFGGFGLSDMIEVYLPQDYVSSLSTEISSGNIKSEGDFSARQISHHTSSGNISLKRLSGEQVYLQASSGNIKTGAIKGKATVKTTSGTITLERVEGSADISASSGDIKVSEAAGSLSAKTNSGTIRIEEADGDIIANATSGTVTVGSLSGGAELNASSGNIRVGVRQLKGNIYAKANSGNITVDIPSGSDFKLAAETTSGSIRTAFDDKLSFNNKGNNASGTIGSGSYLVSLKAGSGNVKVNKP